MYIEVTFGKGTSEDYRLLENMNKLTSLKYMEMKDISINISRNLQDLNNKYASLQPYLDQINQIEEQVSSLEQGAYNWMRTPRNWACEHELIQMSNKCPEAMKGQR
ncbi:hypothetical protein KUCAC02_022467 [Chaenocephalus aceratus]|uniref:Uncharacterized protein n=1 Tax=Chaenocephalus aceratus TaxID=36190 RepID=A0ACB9XND9_CHAAC|nr:hypothetical protein KUCAC02_022467 [Chaenocephalus aceratus]